MTRYVALEKTLQQDRSTSVVCLVGPVHEVDLRVARIMLAPEPVTNPVEPCGSFVGFPQPRVRKRHHVHYIPPEHMLQTGEA